MVTQTALTEASTSRFVQAGGVRLHYNEAGTGHPVIMLHGGGAGASGWSNFVRNLGPLSRQFHVMLVDQPNYGKSDTVPLKEPLTTVAARALKDMLDALGIKKASLIGNSLGGGTALSFAVDYPDRLEKMVLMGSAAGGVDLFTVWPTEGIKILMTLFERPSIEGFRNLINVMCYDASFATDDLLRQRYEAAIANPKHLEAMRGGIGVQRDLMQQLRDVKHDTLIIHGRQDRVVPMEGSMRLLSVLENSRLVVLNKCGHWAQFEKADEFNRMVTDFLSH